MPKAIRFSDEQIREMVPLCEAGKSTRDLAAMYGCGRSAIARVLKRAGATLDAGRSISAKMKGTPGHRLGAKHTPEVRQRMSESRKGRPGTRFGPHSPETLAKISAATKGKNVRYTPEQRIELGQMRARLKRFVRRTLAATGTRKEIPSEKYLGYTRHQLLAHLGPKPFADAEVDHYVPVVEFFRRGITDPAAVNALVNLRWISSSENKTKGDAVPSDAETVIAACLSASRGLPT